MSETNKIEYKLEFNSDTDIEKEVIAFLNYKEGGFVYIGIDKDGDIVGVSNADECMLKIKDRLKNNINPSSIGEIASSKQELSFAQLRIYYEEKGISLNDNFIKTLDLHNSEGKFNYFANLLSDNSNVSFKVAK